MRVTNSPASKVNGVVVVKSPARIVSSKRALMSAQRP
jgi:hypothetical protein